MGEWHGVETDSEHRVVNLFLPRNGVEGMLNAIFHILAKHRSTLRSWAIFADCTSVVGKYLYVGRRCVSLPKTHYVYVWRGLSTLNTRITSNQQNAVLD